MTYKPEQAQLFYAALTGMQNPPLVWQWFCDYDKDRRDLAGWEYAYMNPAKLADLQSRGCGVFTSVNGSTTGGRGKNDIDIFRAIFMDSDGAPFPDQWPIPPHAIVKRDDTHFHAYWFIDGDCSAMEWMIAQKQIALHFGSDESMVNPDRVMRVPGFLHQKSLDNRVLYELAELHADMPRYKLRDVISRFTLTDEKMMKMGEWVRQRSAQYVGGMDDFDDNEHNCKQFITYLKERAEQSISGQGGNHVLFKTAAAGRDYQLSPQKTYELMIDYWDANNEPPWGDEMWPTVQNVYKYSQNGVGARSFAARLTEQAAMLPGMSLTPVEQAIYVPELTKAQTKAKAQDDMLQKKNALEAILAGNTEASAQVDFTDFYGKQHDLNATTFFTRHAANGQMFIYREELYVFTGKVYEKRDLIMLAGMMYAELGSQMPGSGDVNGATDLLKHKLRMNAPAKLPEWRSDPTRDTSGCLVFNNCILDLNTNEVFPHTHDLRTTSMLPYDYDPEAKCPNWLAFLQSIWGSTNAHPDNTYAELIPALQKFMGYLLLDDISLHKMAYLIGKPRAGKSMITKVMNCVYGHENIGNPSLDTLTEPAIQAAIWNKKVAIINDAADNVSRKSDLVSLIKNISGGDYREVNRKFLQPITVQFRCRIVITSNTLPALTEASSAMVDRGLFFPFNRSFAGREDLSLENKLTAETQGILNWCIEGLRMLNECGRRLVNPACATEEVDTFRTLSNPLGSFIDTCLITKQGATCSALEVFARYRHWMADTGSKGGYQDPNNFYRNFRAQTDLNLVMRNGNLVVLGAFIRPIEEPDNGILYE